MREGPRGSRVAAGWAHRVHAGGSFVAQASPPRVLWLSPPPPNSPGAPWGPCLCPWRLRAPGLLAGGSPEPRAMHPAVRRPSILSQGVRQELPDPPPRQVAHDSPVVAIQAGGFGGGGDSSLSHVGPGERVWEESAACEIYLLAKKTNHEKLFSQGRCCVGLALPTASPGTQEGIPGPCSQGELLIPSLRLICAQSCGMGLDGPTLRAGTQSYPEASRFF